MDNINRFSAILDSKTSFLLAVLVNTRYWLCKIDFWFPGLFVLTLTVQWSAVCTVNDKLYIQQIQWGKSPAFYWPCSPFSVFKDIGSSSATSISIFTADSSHGSSESILSQLQQLLMLLYLSQCYLIRSTNFSVTVTQSKITVTETEYH